QARERKLSEIAADREDRIHVEQRRYAEEHARLTAERREQLDALERIHQANVERITQQWTSRIEAAQSELEKVTSQRRRQQQNEWVQLKTEWEQGWQEFDTVTRHVVEQSRQQFLSWSQLAQGNWQPRAEIPEAIRLGDYQIDLNRW